MKKSAVSKQFRVIEFAYVWIEGTIGWKNINDEAKYGKMKHIEVDSRK